jgi:monooxygenase
MISVPSDDSLTPTDSGHETYDVIIIGAGLAGIGSAYWLQEKCPDKSYLILEAREDIGGTWDLFRYPGVRSDSDMFTYGYKFRPWQNPQSLSKGEDILDYIRETAAENGIDKNILFNHKVTGANWSDEENQWKIEASENGNQNIFYTKFLYICTGYYNYDEAYRPSFEGEVNFNGKIILPQFWPKDLDYTGKDVVVVGSGATAVTLIPSMAEQARSVTMLQRSPSYIMNLPNKNGLFVLMKKFLPLKSAYAITRRFNLTVSILIYKFSKAFPKRMKKMIMKGAAAQLGPEYEVEKHFNPSYNPWDQRLCIVPDGDLFKAIKSGKASVVTDHIDRFTEKGIQLKSGQELEADIIILATGLKLKLLGGATISINGTPVDTNNSVVYKGMMISDVPNMAIAFGYTNASWTLKTDLTANYVCDLLNHMDKKGYEVVIPKKDENLETESFMNFDAGYIKRANHILPKQGTKKPWRVYQNYFQDMLAIRYGKLDDGVIQFKVKEEKYDTKG